MRPPRTSAIAVALTGIMIMISGCAGPSTGAAGDVVTLTFESYNFGTKDVGGKGTQELIDKFEAGHPNIRIEPTGTPAGEIHTSVHAKAAAGNPPDVAQLGWSKFGFVQQNLPYVPLDEVAPPDQLAAHLEGMYPAAVELGKHDGKLAGLAYSVSTPTIMINADLFAEAGLDHRDPPSTWTEAKQAALAIKKAGAQGIYVDAAGESKSDFLTQSLINSNGGRLIGDDGSLQLDQPAAVGALGMLGDLTKSGAQPAVGESEAIAMFEAGQLGMLVTSTSLLGGLASSNKINFELETAGLPAFEGHEVAPTVSGAGLFVFATEPKKQAAAWEFIRFLTSEDGFTILASVIGYLPLRPAMINDPRYLGDFFAKDDRLLPTIKQLDSLVPYQVLPGRNSQQAVELIQDNAVGPIMISGADPESTLRDVAARVRELLDR